MVAAIWIGRCHMPTPGPLGVNVPDQEAIDALSARRGDPGYQLSALGAGSEPVPPDPPDPIPPDPGPDPGPGTGVQAKRIVDLVELFGVNTFSSMDTGNIWGSWPADYRPQTVIAALNWITNG